MRICSCLIHTESCLGENAKIDLGGAFIASTADKLILENGFAFHSMSHASDALITDPASLLASSPPSAFGFNTANPSGINISQLSVTQGQPLIIVGGGIEVKDGTGISNPSGIINLVSVGQVTDPSNIDGRVVVSGTRALTNQDYYGFDTLGNILIESSSISTKGNPGGSIFISGGQLVLRDTSNGGAFLNSQTDGLTDHSTALPGISINVQGDVRLEGGQAFGNEARGAEISTTTFQASSAGDIKIVASKVEIENNAGIFSQAFSETGNTGEFKGGLIDIDANEVLLKEGAAIRVKTFGPGNGGTIDIRARNTEKNRRI